MVENPYKSEIEHGEQLFLQGKIYEAMDIFDSILRIDPENVVALNDKGVVLNKQGSYEQAIEMFLTALSIDDENANAAFNLISNYFTLGKIKEAANILEEYKDCLNPQDAEMIRCDIEKIMPATDSEPIEEMRRPLEASLKEHPTPGPAQCSVTKAPVISLFFPIGSGTGWGTCGKYLALELSKMGEVCIVTEFRPTLENVGDELEYFAVSQIQIHAIDVKTLNPQKTYMTEGVSIRTLNDFDLRIWLDRIKSEKTIGYTFYCGFPLSPEQRDAARKLDLIVAGSSFCEEQLNEAGIEKTKTIIQGINPQIFNPANSQKTMFRDRFVVFSGGKLEFRKGQDIVMRAFKIFSDTHPDALLVNSWFNFWEFSLRTMAASTLIDFTFDSSNYRASMMNLYRMIGLRPDQVITLPIKPSFQMPHIYKNSDVGLFPNRCEGGTNLMLMEYMACGKPAIASAQTGHQDIIRQDHAFALDACPAVKISQGDLSQYQGWVEPDVDEIVSLLERAYDNPEECKQKGEAAGRFLSELTWEKAAAKFYETALAFI